MKERRNSSVKHSFISLPPAAADLGAQASEEEAAQAKRNFFDRGLPRGACEPSSTAQRTLETRASRLPALERRPTYEIMCLDSTAKDSFHKERKKETVKATTGTGPLF